MNLPLDRDFDPTRTPPSGAWRWELGFGALLLVTNVVGYLVASDTQRLIAEPAVAVVALWLARRAGLSFTELGLGRAYLRPGLLVGLAVSAVVAGGALVGALLPLTRNLLADDAIASQGFAAAVVVAAVRVPWGTAAPEEVLFRGVTFAALARRVGPGRATYGSAALFGLWHVDVLLGVWSDLPAASMLPGPLGALGGVLAVGAATAAAGVVFCYLRRLSGSLLAPFLVHWAANGTMRLAAAVASGAVAPTG